MPALPQILPLKKLNWDVVWEFLSVEMNLKHQCFTHRFPIYEHDVILFVEVLCELGSIFMNTVIFLVETI